MVYQPCEQKISGFWGDLMENIMYVKWDTGHMTINLDVFFPVNLAKFKKLLKVIALDWENCDRLTEDLKVYFQNQVVECNETAKQSARDYSNLRQKVSDLEIMVKTRKKPVGVSLTQPELEKAREDLSRCRKQTADALSNYKQNTANVKKFQRLLEE